jgi:hypothetical protein
MTTTVDFISYHLKVKGQAVDPVWAEAERHGATLQFNRYNDPVIVMPETNQYNSFFALKYSDSIRQVTRECWYL